jgi:phage shock protein A
MTNEEKIVSMLDIVAEQVITLTGQMTTLTGQVTTLSEQVTTLTETSVTKDELNGFKDELNGFREGAYDRFGNIEKNINSIEENMITKDEFNGFREQVNERFSKLDTENGAAHEAILAKMDKQSESLDGKFDALNRRIFSQEAELSVLRKREAL